MSSFTRKDEDRPFRVSFTMLGSSDPHVAYKCFTSISYTSKISSSPSTICRSPSSSYFLSGEVEAIVSLILTWSSSNPHIAKCCTSANHPFKWDNNMVTDELLMCEAIEEQMWKQCLHIKWRILSVRKKWK